MPDDSREQTLPDSVVGIEPSIPNNPIAAFQNDRPAINIDSGDEPRDVLNKVAEDESYEEKASTVEVINYKGVEIKGVSYLEQQGILSREDVMELLNQLPDSYFEKVHLKAIVFENSKYYTVERNGGIELVRESDIQPRDKISRRVRGQALWNSELLNGHKVLTDGRQTIQIFSTLDWEGEKDKDVALYSLAHELGHTTWNALDKKQGLRFWQHLVDQGKIKPFNLNLPFGFISEWQKLPKSQLPRYTGYKADFSKEHGRSSDGETMEESLQDLAWQEDFATAHEYFLYWKNLQQQDGDRNDWLVDLYEILGENETTTQDA